MPVSIEELRPHLQAFDFPRLFVEGPGLGSLRHGAVRRSGQRAGLYARSHCGEDRVRRLRVRLQRPTTTSPSTRSAAR